MSLSPSPVSFPVNAMATARGNFYLFLERTPGDETAPIVLVHVTHVHLVVNGAVGGRLIRDLHLEDGKAVFNTIGQEPIVAFSPAPHSLGAVGAALKLSPYNDDQFIVEVGIPAFSRQFWVEDRVPSPSYQSMAYGQRYIVHYGAGVHLGPHIVLFVAQVQSTTIERVMVREMIDTHGAFLGRVADFLGH
jgi:hypothetical protein